MKIDKEIDRLLKLKGKTSTACWLSSQMRLSLERAYAIKEERERVLNIINEWEKRNTEVLTTDKLKKDKVIIADYIKWDKIKELKNAISGGNGQ